MNLCEPSKHKKLVCLDFGKKRTLRNLTPTLGLTNLRAVYKTLFIKKCIKFLEPKNRVKMKMLMKLTPRVNFTIILRIQFQHLLNGSVSFSFLLN